MIKRFTSWKSVTLLSFQEHVLTVPGLHEACHLAFRQEDPRRAKPHGSRMLHIWLERGPAAVPGSLGRGPKSARLRPGQKRDHSGKVESSENEQSSFNRSEAGPRGAHCNQGIPPPFSRWCNVLHHCRSTAKVVG